MYVSPSMNASLLFLIFSLTYSTTPSPVVLIDLSIANTFLKCSAILVLTSSNSLSKYKLSNAALSTAPNTFLVASELNVTFCNSLSTLLVITV